VVRWLAEGVGYKQRKHFMCSVVEWYQMTVCKEILQILWYRVRDCENTKPPVRHRWVFSLTRRSAPAASESFLPFFNLLNIFARVLSLLFLLNYGLRGVLGGWAEVMFSRLVFFWRRDFTLHRARGLPLRQC
jgi:hypothetical protein